MARTKSTPINDRSRELAELVGSLAKEDGLFETAWPGLIVSRISAPIPRVPVPYKPSLCMVVQGQKNIYLGDQTYTYDPLHYLVVPLAIPLEMEAPQASRANPILGLGLEFDLTTISELLVNIDDAATSPQTADLNGQALFISRTGPTMQDALIRLLRLLDDPTDLRIIGPSVTREILYRLLQGEQGGQLRRLVMQNGNSHRITGVIRFLNEQYRERLSIEDIARQAGMSTSSLHHKFREMTGMSPLQYLKKIRLHNARTMMVEQGLQAGEAAYRVGYANPSQFNREFKRMFGLPPGQMVRDLLSVEG